MIKKSAIWFLTVAFLSFTSMPDLAGAETVSSRDDAGVAAGVEEGSGGIQKNETFNVRESLQLAQANDAGSVMNEGSAPRPIRTQEGTNRDIAKGEGLSGATTVAVVVGVILLAVVIAAAASGGYGGAGVNIGFGH
jgi:hypothetical protein